MAKEVSQKQLNLLAVLLVLFMVGGSFGLVGYYKRAEKKALQKLEQRNAARGQDFANYVFDDVKTYVLEHQPSQKEIDFEVARYDSQLQEEVITTLAKDSATYARAILRDAPVVISYLDGTIVFVSPVTKEDKPVKTTMDNSFKATLNKNGKTNTPFEKAMEYIQSQKALITMPEYKYEPVFASDSSVLYYDKVPTGKMVVQGSNPSEAYKMKVNIEHLRNISTILARERAVRAQAVRNVNIRGK